MARSTRQRKAVNYKKLLEDASEDSDGIFRVVTTLVMLAWFVFCFALDDFASGPPSKKSRGGVMCENSSRSNKSKSKDTQAKSTAPQEQEVVKMSGR